MQTPKSEASGGRPSKRMRIGTKSCAECRRRKVRCIFDENQRVCKECITHDAHCAPQQPGRRAQGSDQSTDNEGAVHVQQRLEELEGMVSHICKAIDLDIESASMADFKTSTREALKRLRDTSSPETREEEVRSTDRRTSLRTSESEIMEDSSEQNEAFEDAPLIALFKDAMFIQKNDTAQANGRPLGRYVEQRMKACVDVLTGLLPRNEDLTAILKTTQKYWNIWPIPPSGLVTCKGRLPPITDVASAENFIFDALKSGVPTRTTKAVLWLTLCIQQLSIDFLRQRPLPTSQNSLIDSYMSGADTLLSIDEESGGSVEGLECLALRAKLYINMGKPRKAWLCVRHAMNIAIQLGLHRLDKPTSERQQRAWEHIWQNDRQLSLILGFPNGIPDANIRTRRESVSPSPHTLPAKIAHDFAIAAGHISDRNQSHVPVVDYSVTEQIEQELTQCKAAMPPEWWDDAACTPNLPLHEIYTREVVKATYYQLLKFLHLPYMLKPPSSLNPDLNQDPDPRYEQARLSVLSACREMVRAYHRLRTLTSPDVIMCDLLDFQVFGSAAVIVLDLLLHVSSPSSPSCIYQEGQDWGLVGAVTRSLRDKTALMECTVAGQAAQLLEYLSTAHRGTYAGPEGYEAVIPYFGKVTIGKMKKNLDIDIEIANPNSIPYPLIPPSISSGGSDLQTTLDVENIPQQPQFSNMVEFSANTFMPFGQETMAGCFYPDTELGVDWTSVFDVDRSYDWNEAADAFGYSV